MTVGEIQQAQKLIDEVLEQTEAVDKSIIAVKVAVAKYLDFLQERINDLQKQSSVVK